MQNGHSPHRHFLFFFLLLPTLFVPSCGTNEDYGTELIPPGWNDSLLMTDTLTVLTYCAPDDTLQMTVS